MKKILLILTAIGMILMVAVAACKKDEKSGSGGGNASVVNATNISGDDDSEVDYVKALIIVDEGEYPDGGNYWTGYEAGASEYKNHGFKINLSATVPDKYLESWSDEWGEEFMSDKNAKVAVAWMVAYDDEGGETGEFYWEYGGENADCETLHVYADRNFTVKGTYDGYGEKEIFNCNFRKGWNILYGYDDYKKDEFIITTQKPSNVNLVWYYYSYYHNESATKAKIFDKLNHKSNKSS
jgi:hypothetical protein